MKRLACLAASLVLTVAPAIAGQAPMRVPVDREHLVGRYHYEEKDGADLFTVDVALNADGTALYAVGMGGEGGIRAKGFWDIREGVIHIHNRPGPVRLEQVGPPTTDPNVALSITATLPDGSPAQGLGVTWPNAGGLYMFDDGAHRVRREEGPVVGRVTIERGADGKTLASFDMVAGAPNAYRFLYHPSDAEPFDFSAIALDAKAEMIEVELGGASARLHRVRG
jgi:hypothetical protein